MNYEDTQEHETNAPTTVESVLDKDSYEEERPMTVGKPSPAASPAAPTESKTSFMSVFKANPLYPRASELVNWRDPWKSGLVFGIFTFSYILLGWLDYTVVTLGSYLLLALLGVCFLYRAVVHGKSAWLLGKASENPFLHNFKGVDFHVSKEDAIRHLETILELVNLTIDRFTEVFFITNYVRSLKYMAYFYASAIVGTMFGGLTLLYLAVLVAFVFPRTYEEYKTEIDRVADRACGEYKKYLALGMSKLPPFVQQKLSMIEKKRD